MAHWMVSNRLFGRHLRDYQAGLGIPLKTKVLALTIMWTSLALSAYLVPIAWVRLLLLIPGIGVTVYLWRYKTKPVGLPETLRSPDDQK